MVNAKQQLFAIIHALNVIILFIQLIILINTVQVVI